MGNEKCQEIFLRKACLGDCRDVWLWRNDPGVRKLCFDSRKIAFEEHESWFNNKLESANSLVFICEDEKKEKVGQIRFDIKGDAAFVNINLNPEFIGKSLGNRIIKESTELFLKENPGIVKVLAEILDDNIASKKSFNRAGYDFCGDATRGDKKAVVMSRLNK